MTYPTKGKLAFVTRGDDQVRWELRAANGRVLAFGPWRSDDDASLENWNRVRAIITGFEYEIVHERRQEEGAPEEATT